MDTPVLRRKIAAAQRARWARVRKFAAPQRARWGKGEGGEKICSWESFAICSSDMPVMARSFHLIGKETERGWEQSDDIRTFMPSLVRYGADTGVADEQLRKRLGLGYRAGSSATLDVVVT